jgi:hypothetical protein
VVSSNSKRHAHVRNRPALPCVCVSFSVYLFVRVYTRLRRERWRGSYPVLFLKLPPPPPTPPPSLWAVGGDAVDGYGRTKHGARGSTDGQAPVQGT